ncbi:MAG: hypothetical protein WBZ33_01295, partial [Thermoactinomyces sp.]
RQGKVPASLKIEKRSPSNQGFDPDKFHSQNHFLICHFEIPLPERTNFRECDEEPDGPLFFWPFAIVR